MVIALWLLGRPCVLEVEVSGCDLWSPWSLISCASAAVADASVRAARMALSRQLGHIKQIADSAAGNRKHGLKASRPPEGVK